MGNNIKWISVNAAFPPETHPILVVFEKNQTFDCVCNTDDCLIRVYTTGISLVVVDYFKSSMEQEFSMTGSIINDKSIHITNNKCTDAFKWLQDEKGEEIRGRIIKEKRYSFDLDDIYQWCLIDDVKKYSSSCEDDLEDE